MSVVVVQGSDFFLEQPASTMGATPSTQDPSSSSYCYLHRRRRGFPLLLLGLMYIFFLCSSFPAVSGAHMPGRTMAEMDSEKVRVRLCVRLPHYECPDPPQCNCCLVTELCYTTMAECIIEFLREWA
ncbi:uncharacterized protein [Triticum aestivum]|uniref:uncharacterized protein n=1 Tax=Triticum aestivum TaxID=4565 RepID=UPI001D0269A7|nr:uncharacterized protein LOC123179491 [Triticum aestivum]